MNLNWTTRNPCLCKTKGRYLVRVINLWTFEPTKLNECSEFVTANRMLTYFNSYFWNKKQKCKATKKINFAKIPKGVHNNGQKGTTPLMIYRYDSTPPTANYRGFRPPNYIYCARAFCEGMRASFRLTRTRVAGQTGTAEGQGLPNLQYLLVGWKRSFHLSPLVIGPSILSKKKNYVHILVISTANYLHNIDA